MTTLIDSMEKYTASLRKMASRVGRTQYSGTPLRPGVGRLLCVALALVTFWQPSLGLALDFSPQEQRYIADHPSVTLCVDPDWVPFESINEKGQHEGIAADLLNIVSLRTGIAFTLVPTHDWNESLAASRDGRCQVLSFLNKTPNREEWLLFTAPIFNDSNVFITREEHGFIDDPATLIGESIVFPSGTSMEERIHSQYPNLRILVVDSEEEALDMVSQRKANMTMRSLIVAAYTIRKEGWFNLKIAGRLPDYANNLRLGVVRSEPVLRDILDKGVDTITPQERGQIVNKHVAINVQTAVNKPLVLKLLAAFVLVIAVAVFWAYKLKRYNTELRRLSLTDLLTDLPNRRHILSHLERELERARRTGRALACIMLDIDHFKHINDVYGHQMGDHVLVAFAGCIRANCRKWDVAGRWGGEEFLVLCPETTSEQAEKVASRIVTAVAAHAFATSETHTVSAGVASLASGDTIDNLLQRADKALYSAKQAGRNRVCVIV